MKKIRISIIDTIGFHYDHTTLNERPLGGTQSLAVSLAYYLAAEEYLIKVYTNGAHNYNLDKVNYIGLNNGITSSDYFIVVNNISEKQTILLKKTFPNSKLILWWHFYSTGKFKSNKLIFFEKNFDKIVLVSDYAAKKSLDLNINKKVIIIKNFLPFMPDIFKQMSNFDLVDKLNKKIDFAYLGNTTRGLNYIPMVADFLLKNNIKGKIKIFSGLKLYNPFVNLDNSQQNELFKNLNKHPKIKYIKKIGKKDMFNEFKSCRILLSPNPYYESFCVSAIEAMFFGLLVVSTKRAAIPETLNRYGYLAEVENPNTDEKFTIVNMQSFFYNLMMAINDSSNSSRIIIRQTEYLKKNFFPKIALSRWKKLFNSFQ